MGMAIAAGESPNAITNISKGVMATIDNFTSDDKERRAYKRQVELSAAKYALDGVARDTAQENADERQLFFFYDQSTKDKDNPYGKMVTLSMADIISNGGEIPPNLLGKDLVSSSIVATRDATALLTKNLTDNYAEYKIGRVEAKEYVDQLDEARDALIRSESGINLLAMTKQRIIGANLGSFGTGFKELLRKGATIANIKLDKSYNTVPELRADVQIALQELIKASLGTTQAANSISNKDVELLANAYVDTAFTADGSFSFLGIDEEALGRKLDQAIDTFRNRQKGALSTYDRVLSRLDQSEAALKQAQALGLTVLPGPFTRDHFKSLDEIKPYSDRIQSGDPDSVSPQLGESVISTDSGDFNLIDGKYVYTPRAN